ncbi:disease resistance protein RPV1-like isoform X1 [Apium graveolens]|uniref:disease resistance protein RPV1-like isoform X1 n=1 Tax=Apium graveolens TaxID=4045 RepID=UPI003D7AB378
MAASTTYNRIPSSSGSPPTATLWDIFLCFRGSDTRYNFTDHLYKALLRTGIRTFMDDPELRSGEVISDSLIQAIQNSKAYIVVLSENYASSPWCLDELVEILQCCRTMQRSVIPVFYNIDPSVVRHQMGRFEQAFEKHQTRFDKEKVEKWSLALREVSHFSGYTVTENRSQSDIVDEVVDRILLEINPVALNVAKYPVGLDSRVRSISTLLESDPESVIRIGIHGMGGVGKTTLAKAVYNEHYKRFQGSCFLANVREVSKTDQGLVSLQKQLIGDVLKRTNINIGNVDQGIELIRARICSRKVLIVIDDLDDPKPLEVLDGSLVSGSITIITTRNEDMLDSIKVQAKYKVNELDEDQSCQLFAQHAFGDHKIPHKFTELTIDILKRAGGLPLALRVFGSNLLNQPEEEWRWFIDKLNRVPIDDIEKKLLISFDALKSIDPMLQNIFLDMACFYIGHNVDHMAIRIMEACYTHVHRNIDILKKRCMLTIDEYGILGMHDLLRDMGREIARNNSSDEPGKYSRLWVSEDVNTVLKNYKGTEAIHGIIYGKFDYEKKVEGVTFNSESFKRMSKLRFLYLNNVNLTGSFEQTFEDLRWFHWVHCPLECLPSNFYPQKLVVLELPFSNMRTMGEQNMVLLKLKTLDMSHSPNLITAPDFTLLPCLETLDLQGCSNLRSLPDSICSLRALKILNLRCCSRLEALPTKLGSIESLKELGAGNLNVSILPDSMGRLSNLVKLDFSSNKNLETLPDSMSNLGSLEEIFAEECCSLKRFPDLSSLKHLKKLNLMNCEVLKEIQGLEEATSLEHLWLQNCRSLERLPNLSNFKQLKSLNLPYCESLKEIQGLEEVTSLKYLRLNNCTSLERLPSLCNLKQLEVLDISHCNSLKEIIGLEEHLEFDCCNLSSVSKLPPSLQWVHAEGCTSLKRFPNSSNLKQLEELKLSNCRSLESLPNLSNSKQLKRLDLRGCSGLTEIQGLEELTSLQILDMVGCNLSLLTERFFEVSWI